MKKNRFAKAYNKLVKDIDKIEKKNLNIKLKEKKKLGKVSILR